MDRECDCLKMTWSLSTDRKDGVSFPVSIAESLTVIPLFVEADLYPAPRKAPSPRLDKWYKSGISVGWKGKNVSCNCYDNCCFRISTHYIVIFVLANCSHANQSMKMCYLITFLMKYRVEPYRPILTNCLPVNCWPRVSMHYAMFMSCVSSIIKSGASHHLKTFNINMYMVNNYHVNRSYRHNLDWKRNIIALFLF